MPLLNKGLRVIDVLDIQYGPLPTIHDAFTASSPNYHHTMQDTFDKVSAKSLQIVGDVAVTLVNRVDRWTGGRVDGGRVDGWTSGRVDG